MRILLVEDLSADAILFREALRDAGLAENLDVVRDGQTALDQLRSRTRPDLVLLDLNLPGKSGREVLGEIRADPSLDGLPIVVVSTSNAPKDVAFAYAHHANAYVRKPNGFDALSALARAIRGLLGPGRDAAVALRRLEQRVLARQRLVGGGAGEALELGRRLGGERGAVLDQARSGVGRQVAGAQLLRRAVQGARPARRGRLRGSSARILHQRGGQDAVDEAGRVRAAERLGRLDRLVDRPPRAGSACRPARRRGAGSPAARCA